MGQSNSRDKKVHQLPGPTVANSQDQTQRNADDAADSGSSSHVDKHSIPRKSQHSQGIASSANKVLVTEVESDKLEETKTKVQKRYSHSNASTQTNDSPSEEFSQKAVIRELKKENEELRNKELAARFQIDEYAKEIKLLKAEKNKMFSSSGKAQNIVEKEKEILRLKEENELLQLRLSRIASDHLTDNNPDIADLSDPNRAIKLVEQFSEIYCNEWTAAYDNLQDHFKKSDRESIKILLEILKAINAGCKKRAKNQSETLTKNVKEFIGTDELPHNVTVTLKALKDARKRSYTLTLLNVQDQIQITLTTVIEPEVLEDPKLMAYVKTITGVCWLMNISDPPLVFYAKCKPGTQLDKNYFVEYMSPGDTVDFLVWPALLLCKDGAILRKGIAEPK